MKKKFAGLALAVGVVGTSLVGGASSAFADTAGWQQINSEYIDPNSTSWVTVATDEYAMSGGGNVGIRVPKHSVSSHGGDKAVLEVQLMEYDANNPDDPIGTAYFYPERMTGTLTKSFSVDQFEDGTNGDAEVYAIWKANYNSLGFYSYTLD